MKLNFSTTGAKIAFSLFVLSGSFSAVNAQNVGISADVNFTPNASAMLDISSTNKGLLAPRVNLTSDVSNPANGLLVYQTGGTPGFYYNSGTSGTPVWFLIANTTGTVSSVTANNGLTSSGGNTPNITLGGALNANTTIPQGNFNMVYNLTGTGDFEVRDNGVSALFVKDDGTIGINTNSPDATAIMDIVSTNKGLLIPRMTFAERNLIVSPANSLIIYNTTTRCLDIFTDGAWQSFYCSCPVLDPLQSIAGASPVCSGSTVSYTVPGVTGAANYAWTVSGVLPGSITGNGSTAISFPAPASNTFTVSVTASNACNNSSSSQSTSVNAYTSVPPTPTASSSPTAICQDAGYNYSITNGLGINGTTAINYTWTITTTGTASATLTANSQTAIAGSPVTYTSTATAVTINIGATGSGNVTVSVVGNNTCGSSAVARTWTLPVNVLSANPTSATASASTICNGASTALTLNGGGGGTGEVIRWYTSSCGGTLVGTGNGLSVSPTTTTTYYGRYEDPAPCSYNTPCQSVTITVDQLSVAPTSISGATGICDGSSAPLSVIGGSLGTGAVIQWFTGSCGGTSAGTGNSITVSPTSNTTYYVRYSGTCNTTTCASLSITVDQFTAANAGPDQVLCATSATLAGNSPTTGQGTWSVVSGSGTFGNANSATSTVSGLSTGVNVFRWTLPNGGCTDSQDEVSITSQSSSVAPTSITGTTTICNSSSTTISVSGGSAGTGAVAEWFTVSCGGTSVGTGASISVSPTSNITYYVRYSGSCNTTTCVSQAVTVDQFTTASAGSDQSLCATTATLAGNTPTTGGGTWTLVSGVGTITSSTSPTSGITALGVGTNTFRWTLLNGACTDSQDDVIITGQSSSVAPTGVTGTTAICSGSSTTLTVAGGSAGSGATTEWFTGSCGGTSAGTGNSISVGPTSATTYYVRYNGTCNTTACASQAVIVNQFTTASAGTDQSLCATTATLAGNTPTTGGGTWTVFAGSGTITSPTSPTSGITALGVGSNTFRWTLLNGVCNDSQDDVVITGSSPSTAPSSISGTTPICNGSAVTLTAVGGTLGTGASYQWGTGTTVGSNVIGGATSVTYSPTPTTNTTYWVQIVNTSAPCTANTGGPTLAIVVDYFTTAAAGPDQTICANSATLAGNTPTTGVGTWTVVGGSGTFTSATSPTSAVTGLGIGNNTFRWTFLNGACATSTDDVVINSSIVAAPTSVTASPSSILNGQSTNLNATSAGNRIAWYTVASGGAPVGTSESGANFSVSPTTTTTYYAQAQAISSISYSQSFTTNVTPTTQATEWCTFRSQLLASYSYTSLTVSSQYGSVSITDPTAILAIANAMRTSGNYSGVVGGNTWYVTSGSCVAGSSPCGGSGVVLHMNDVSCTCNSGMFVIRPEINNGAWGGVGTAHCGGLSQTINVVFGIASSGCSSTTRTPVTVTVTSPPAACTHSITLYDTYGDGWHGNNFVYVRVNGTLVGTYTLGSGYGPAAYNFQAAEGATIQVTYSAGSWAGECYYTVRGGNGVNLVTNWFPASSGTWNGTGDCP